MTAEKDVGSEFRLLYLRRRAEDADRLTERLTRLQWSGSRVRYRTGWLAVLALRVAGLDWANCCPVCQRTPQTGHAEGCWLGQELNSRPTRPR